jgi:hypothetical protein
MNNSELFGTLALVRPDLENKHDPHKGEVGVLAYIDNDNKVYMRFPKGGEAIYEPNELFQLDQTEHLPAIKSTGEQVSLQDYKDLFKIDLLQKMGRSTDSLQALEIAAANPGIWERALKSVEQQIEIKQDFAYAR